jgi:hypothetical protein
VPKTGLNQGTKLAIGVLLLWFAGACLFVAFLSGKVDSLTQGTDQSGNPQGPADFSSLIVRLAQNAQALAGNNQTGSTTASSQTEAA